MRSFGSIAQSAAALLFALVLALITLSAQQPPAQAPAQAPGAATDGAAKFTSSTQLVIETVMVKDKSGKPIEGLTAKDFTITEDGKPQTISFCEFQKLKDAVETVPTFSVR